MRRWKLRALHELGELNWPRARIHWTGLATAAVLAPALTMILAGFFLGVLSGLRGGDWGALASFNPFGWLFAFTFPVLFGFVASFWVLGVAFFLASLGKRARFGLAGAIAGAVHSLAGAAATQWDVWSYLVGTGWGWPYMIITGFGLHAMPRANSLAIILPAAMIAGWVAGVTYAKQGRRMMRLQVRKPDLGAT